MMNMNKEELKNTILKCRMEIADDQLGQIAGGNYLVQIEEMLKNYTVEDETWIPGFPASVIIALEGTKAAQAERGVPFTDEEAEYYFWHYFETH